MNQSTPLLSLRNVGVCFRRRNGIFRSREHWALNDISFDIYEGEVIGLIGPNGAGKSTVLRVVADIIRPDRGDVIRTGNQVASLLSLQVGFAHHLTGRENILSSGMLLGMSRKMLKEREDDIVEFTELGEFIDSPVWTYSMGMRARLGFAIAKEADPDFLLLDEMLGVGDASFKTKSNEAMNEKIKSGKTVMLVSHSMQTIEDLCNRVIWIRQGKVVDTGSPDEIIPAYEKWSEKLGNSAGRFRSVGAG